MTKNSIFLFVCIYNLEVLNYNQMKPSIEILTRSPINLEALVLNFAQQPSIEPRNARDWVEARSDVIQSTQNPNNETHMATSVRNAASGELRLKSVVVDILYEIVRDNICNQIHWVD